MSGVDDAVEAIRNHVGEQRGRLVSENERGAGLSWSAQLVVRLPPASLDGLITKLEELGVITEKQISAEDVGKKLFDQEIALANRTATLARLRQLIETPNLKMTEVLEIEREMARLRSEIESIKGENRYLKDRVAFATLRINLQRDGGAVLSPTAKLFPGPRLSTLVLIRPGSLKRVRPGIGGTIQFPGPGRFSIDLDVFKQAEDEGSASVMLTTGAALYSDFLGRGRRRFLNPYVGFRAGYAHLDGSKFVAVAEAGLELVKSSRFLVDSNVRAVGFFGENSRAGIVAGLSAVIAF